MRLDSLNTFATNVATGNTGTRILGDVIDISDVRDIGAGTPVYLNAVVGTAIAAGAGGTYQLKLTTADNAALSTNPVDVFVSVQLDAAAGIPAGTVIANVALPAEVGYKQFIGVQEVVGTANTTAGAVSAHLSYDQLAYQAYPKAED